MTIEEYLKKDKDFKEYENIKKYLSEKEYELIKNKIDLIKSHYNKIELEYFIYRKEYITKDIIALLYDYKIDKKLLNKTIENSNKYILDKRSPIMFDLNLILGESQELLFLLNNLNFQINPNSKHNTRIIKSSYDADFVCDDTFIEFQSTVNPKVDDIIIKQAKLNGLKKLYKNNCYILQQKIEKEEIKYKILNVDNAKIEKEIERFSFKKEFVLKTNPWQYINSIKCSTTNY